MGRNTQIFTSIFLLLLFSPQEILIQGFEDSASRTLKQEPGRAHEVHCSRERSRTAWGVIEEYLMPFVEQEQYEISSKCRLHPDNDMFRDQEQHKIHVDINEWRCGYCKKSFRAEKFLDQHFDNRHNNLLNVSHGKCLADLCGALHCDFMMNSKSSRSKCNPAAVAKNRHLCESLANRCFPINQGSSASRLHELFLRQFCDAHKCPRKSQPFPKGGRKQPSVFYLAISILTLMLLPIFYLIVYLYQRYVSSTSISNFPSFCENLIIVYEFSQRNERRNPRA
ncbi:C2H2-type domain-containing protein [Citrus sinensis]|uniref:C2H2-type domain-containing protein n=1 Tax=Citrus sinensis TaxID=2711 RepID=A0ACB8LTD2_CITSI|nr:C2H2-type domain-containing protein [Citrus sinensis]